IDSPLLVLAFGAVSIEPGPNRFRTLDIPLVRAGVVEGRVRRATPQGPQGLAGGTLILTHRRTGERRSPPTLPEGGLVTLGGKPVSVWYVYTLRAKPDVYGLTVDARVLEALHASAQPLRLTVAPTTTGAGLSGLEVLLTPKPYGAGGPPRPRPGGSPARAPRS